MNLDSSLSMGLCQAPWHPDWLMQTGPIGYGSGGEVYRCCDASGRLYAVKVN